MSTGIIIRILIRTVIFLMFCLCFVKSDYWLHRISNNLIILISEMLIALILVLLLLLLYQCIEQAVAVVLSGQSVPASCLYV